MSRKAHSFVHEYPRIRIDRFTDAREAIPDFLLPPPRDAEGNRAAGPWDDFLLDDSHFVAASTSSKRRRSGVNGNGSSSTTPTGPFFPHPTVQLLTHIHMDHLEGLSIPQTNGAPIYCSHATKEMLLKLESKASRAARDMGLELGQGDRVRQFTWLKVTESQAAAKRRMGVRAVAQDLLYALDFDKPTVVDYLPGKKITITLLDANHMSGSTMFLIEGDRGAVLHMGDCRAEKWWIDALVRHPRMQLYANWKDDDDDDNDVAACSLPSRIGTDHSESALAQSPLRSETQVAASTSTSTHSGPQSSPSAVGPPSHHSRRVHSRLQTIYIDDEWLTTPDWPPGKKDAARDLMQLMAMYPDDTIFWLDCWTFGYEEIFMAIGKMFRDSSGKHGARVHLDWYKDTMYVAANDPCLDVTTSKGATTRFHACERRDGCEHLAEENLSQHAAEKDAWDSVSQHWHGPPPLPLSKQQVESIQESFAARRASQPKPQPPMTVMVRIIEASEESWAELRAKSRADIAAAKRGEAEYPLWLGCPIQRHTTLPEMQRFVRAFRPATVVPTTSNTDHYFIAAKYLGPLLKRGGQARIDEEAKRAIGLSEWQACEEAMKPEEGGSQERTVAQELETFRKRRMELLDLSRERRRQEQGQQQHPQQSGGLQVSTPATRVAVAATALGAITSALPSSSPPAAAGTGASAAGPASTTILDDDLSRRYFIVLRNFVRPGLEITNLPGGTEGPSAWRAVRIVAPHLAMMTEQVMEQELGILPPQWAPQPATTPAAAATSVSGAQALVAPGEADPSKTRSVRGPQEESASASLAQPQKRAKTSAKTGEGGQDDDWLQDLLPSSADAPLRLSADLCTRDQARLAAAHAALEEQTSSLARILNTATKRNDGQSAIAKHHRALCDLLIDTLGILGEEPGGGGGGCGVMKPETLLRLVALMDVALQLVAFVFAATTEVAELKTRQLTISFRECGKGVEALLQGLEAGEGCGSICGGRAWRGEERAESTVLLKRLQRTLGMVETEARR